ncbi:presequence protease, mitochondrial isoform X2 [Hydra vulgaris]|uniref:Presequence protease, mitochondrial isoform X2 n=1 Tax=Hydra vulgaris TaxID=6087 RepID=A0ABM4BIM4_HYDVU
MIHIGKLHPSISTGSRWFPRLVVNSLQHCWYSTVQHSAQVTNQNDKYQVGTQIHGYTVIQSSEIPDFHAHAVMLRHNETGAQHLHITREDQNNVFSVAFRTTPLDNTGVSHILEHTVLCGSAKYPCRDPFFKMLNRSLSTFMNAFTASDWTMYPFSTQNEKDYHNLLSVYLDAAFFPNLRETDFRQEGWRLEHSNLQDVNSPIIFKGIVFNEMKGALSTGESIYQNAYQNLLLPNHTYSFNSGGDPLDIPKLTYDQLKEFHVSHYHPSNARFYTYGTFSLEKHLSHINDHVLKNFLCSNPQTEIPLEPKWSEPRIVTISCPPDNLAADPEKQTTVSVGYMLDYSEDPFEQFVLNILSTLMVSGPNSPFYQSLREPNYGSDYSPVTGLDSQTKNSTFAVGLQGIHENDVEKVVAIIEETFLKIVRDGFEPERIESILHNVELSQKHQTSNFGLALIMAVIPSWNQDKNPISPLFVNTYVQKFKNILEKNPAFLQEKVKECFLNNTHKLTLIMKPDIDYTSIKDQKEMELLSSMTKNFTDAARIELLEQGLKLEAIQSHKDDASVLPKMMVSEIDPKIKETKVEKNMLDDVKIFTCEQPTNGITYFRAIIPTSSLPYVVKPYLPLFCNVLTRLGAGSRNYKELAQIIELTTGGLHASPHLVTNHADNDAIEYGIMLSSHCLERNIPMMFSLWQDILNEPEFNNPDRLRTLINSAASDLSQSVAQSGHLYAMACAAKGLTPAAQLSELFSGLRQVEFMKELSEQEGLDGVIENLMKTAMYICNSNDMRCAINAPLEMLDSSIHALSEMLTSLNTVGFDDPDFVQDADFHPKSQKTFVEMDFPVNYVSKCIRGVPYSHEDYAKLQILLRLMSAKYLHQEIREKGGAYGGGAKVDSGVISFYSYRDPNTLSTLNSFEKSVIWASEGKFTDDDIEEAKLSVFSHIDSPVPPSNRGMPLFKSGLTDEIRQLHRDRLFATNRNDLINVSQRYLLPGAQKDAYAIIGPKNEELRNDPGWKKSLKSVS